MFQAHQTFQAYFFLSYQRVFQAHFIKCFKLISSDVSSLFLLDIWRYWSRLTIDSCLLHACSRACFIRVYYTHVVKLVSFMFIAFDRVCLLFDKLNQEINYWLVIIADSLRVTSSIKRSLRVVLYHCSRLTFLVIQADSFYSASNIQQWISFSSYFRVFRYIVYVLFSFKHIVYVLFYLQYISSLLLSSMLWIEINRRRYK